MWRYSISLRNKNTYISLLLVIVLMAGTGCGKYRKSFVARNWHSFLSLFNGYYNGNVKYKEGARETEKSFKIKQDELISVFAWDTEGAPAGAQFDEAIKKCDVVIYKHPNGKWIDDCRYLNGKANFYKHNTATAILNFEYILAAFPKSDLVPEVKVWLAKSYYLAGYPDKALNYLDKNLKKSTLSPRLRGEAAVLEATLLAQKEKYDKAIDVLYSNIEYVKGRKQKARAWYLLGQLNTRAGKFPKAYESYKKTIKMNTDYALCFNARLQLIRLIADQPSLASRNAEIAKLLKELLREEKNKEFLDQIYYEFATLEIRKNNYDKALSYLRKSLDHSTSNVRQKSLSYYKSGYLYFHEKENYPEAQLYFDSAAAIVTEQAPEYKEVKSMAEILKEYVMHYNNVIEQDSFLNLAAMSPQRRDQAIDKIIQEEKRKKKELEDKLREQKEIQEMNQLMNQQQAMNSTSSTLASSSFNFDDPTKAGSGKLQFQRIWGMRKNEDHWRRSKRPNASLNTDKEKTEEKKQDSKDEESNQAKREKYLSNIPLTDEAKKESHKKIDEGYFGLAQIYHKKLNMPEKAIPWYEKLIKRYPDSPNFLKSYYALYTIYRDLKLPKANAYRNYIINNHPNSMYARLVRSQDITEELKRTEQTFEGAYDALYVVYSQKQYQTVVDFCNYILNTFPEKPKFPSVYYMKGLCFGKMNNVDSMRYMYKYLIQNYPESDAATVARRTLELLDGSTGKTTETVAPAQNEEARFKDFTKNLTPGDEVVVIFLAENQKLNINDLKTKFSNFNSEKFSQDKLSISGILYRQYYVNMVQKFSDFRFAWRYVQTLRAEPTLNMIPKNPAREILFITRKNLNVCIQKNILEDYLAFFEKYHPEMLSGK